MTFDRTCWTISAAGWFPREASNLSRNGEESIGEAGVHGSLGRIEAGWGAAVALQERVTSGDLRKL